MRFDAKAYDKVFPRQTASKPLDSSIPYVDNTADNEGDSSVVATEEVNNDNGEEVIEDGNAGNGLGDCEQ